MARLCKPGGIVINMMTQKYTKIVEEYRDIDKYVFQLADEGRWWVEYPHPHPHPHPHPYPHHHHHQHHHHHHPGGWRRGGRSRSTEEATGGSSTSSGSNNQRIKEFETGGTRVYCQAMS